MVSRVNIFSRGKKVISALINSSPSHAHLVSSQKDFPPKKEIAISVSVFLFALIVRKVRKPFMILVK